MSIRLSCPGCRTALRISSRYAGRVLKCPTCSTKLTAPAAAFNRPCATHHSAPGVSAVSAFDFDAPSQQPADDRFLKFRGPQAKGWRSTRAGLNLIWLGSGLQALTITVWLVASIIFGTGARILSTSQDEAPPPVGAQEAGRFAGLAITAITLGTLAIGTFVRLLGFFRCLATPPGFGAKAWGVGAFFGEMALLGTLGAWLATLILGLLSISLVAGFAAPVIWLAGLVTVLMFLRQIAVALDSKPLRGNVRNFVIWLVGGAVGLAAITVVSAVLYRLVISGERNSGMALAALGTSCFTLVFAVILGLTLLVKYLCLFTTASDQIKRRVGK